jgi:hypothetical protein
MSREAFLKFLINAFGSLMKMWYSASTFLTRYFLASLRTVDMTSLSSVSPAFW